MFPKLERLRPRQEDGTAGGSDPNQGRNGISFSADSFAEDQSIIVLDKIDNPPLPAPPVGLIFTWDLDQAFELVDITWLGMSGPNQEEFEDIDFFRYGGIQYPGTGENQVMIRVQENGVVLNVWGLEDKSDVFINHPMALRIQWEQDSEPRFSQSPAFAVQGIEGNTPGDDEAINRELGDLSDTDRNGYIGLSDPPGGPGAPGGPVGPTPSSTGAMPVPTATPSKSQTQLPTSTAVPGDISNGDGSNSNDDGGSDGGLSTAATAGIAAGAAVAGLAIIGLLVWFFLRRRRNKRKGYKEPHVSNTLMVEKDNQNHTSESVHTPYSDDNANQIRDGPSVPPTHIGYASYDDSYHSPHDDSYQSPHHEPHAQPHHHHHQEPAMPPPSSRQPPSRQHSGFEPMATPGSRSSSRALQTPEGVSRSVAHLVEEGMSAEEIRRLEEEERQLDDEIERAGRR